MPRRRHMTCRDMSPSGTRALCAKRTQPSICRYPPPMFHVLLSLAQGERHGYLIMKEVEERSEG